MSGRIGIITRLRNHLPEDQCAILAQGLVISKIRYCLSAFAHIRINESEQKNVLHEKLQIKMNDLLRLIKGVKRKDKIPIHELSKDLPWSSINRLGIETVALDAWKTIHYEHDLSSEFSIDYQKETRSATQELLKPKSKYFSHFTKQSTKLLNTKDFEDIRHLSNSSEVKKLIRKKIMNFPF